MLTIQSDLSGLNKETHELNTALSRFENIKNHINSGFNCDVFLNGEALLVPSDLLNQPALDSDEIVIVQRMGSSLTRAVKDFHSKILDPFGIVGKINNLLSYKPEYDGTNLGEVSSESSNNSLTGQSNIARLYQARPDNYGLQVCYPDIIQEAVYEYIDNKKFVTETFDIGYGAYIIDTGTIKDNDTPLDDLENANYELFYPDFETAFPEETATYIDDVLESFKITGFDNNTLPSGEVISFSLTNDSIDAYFTMPDYTGNIVLGIPFWMPESETLKQAFDEGATQINFNGYIYGYNEETNSDDPPTVIGYESIHVVQNLNIISYVFSAGVYYFTITRPLDFTMFNDLSLTSGQTLNITTKLYDGDVIGTYQTPVTCMKLRSNFAMLRGLKCTAKVRMSYWNVDAEGNQISATQKQIYTITADTIDQQFRTFDLDLPYEDLYKVQYQRINADDANETTQIKIENAFALKYYETKIYPPDTLIKVITKADESTSKSSRKINLQAMRRATVFDVSLHTVSNTRNFARSLVHEYCVVAGGDVADLDIAALAAINDKYGENNELLRFDYTFDDINLSLGDRMRAICDAARVRVFRLGNKWSFVRDEAKELIPVMQFDYRNIASDGESAVAYNSVVRGSYDSIKLAYTDPNTNKQVYYNVKIDDDGSIVDGVGAYPRNDKLTGCKTVNQAKDRAYLECAKLLYNRITVSETVTNDGFTLQPLDLVRWIDPNDFYADDGLYAGEVLSVDGYNVETSEPIDFGGDTGRVVFTKTNGTVTDVFTCSARIDGKNGFVLSTTPSADIFVADSIRQLGSRYSVGIGISDEEMESSGLYLVQTIEKQSNGLVNVTMTKYNPLAYQYDLIEEA